jgi:peptidoglycan hydrolase CwlO-like protein
MAMSYHVCSNDRYSNSAVNTEVKALSNRVEKIDKEMQAVDRKLEGAVEKIDNLSHSLTNLDVKLDAAMGSLSRVFGEKMPRDGKEAEMAHN